MNNPRYTVELLTGMCTGAGMYQVWDSFEGRPIGKLCYFKSEADVSAARLNTADAQSQENKHLVGAFIA